jgi:hypothetical protein
MFQAPFLEVVSAGAEIELPSNKRRAGIFNRSPARLAGRRIWGLLALSSFVSDYWVTVRYDVDGRLNTFVDNLHNQLVCIKAADKLAVTVSDFCHCDHLLTKGLIQ